MRDSKFALSTFRDVCLLVTDGTHDTPKTSDTGIAFIKAKEITGGVIDFENCEYISNEDHLKVIARSKPEQGDTLFAHIGASLGEAAYVNTNREFSIKNVALFKPNPTKIDGRYLFYYIIAPRFQNEIKGSRTGSAQPFVGLDSFRRHPIQYHRELETQRKIAGVLSTYDELIENNMRRIAILERMAQTLYREWFVHSCQSGKLPRSWERVRIGDRFTTVLGGTPSRARPEYWEGGTIPWINSGKVNELRILDASELITPTGLDGSSTKMMPTRTTIIAITGATLGQVSLTEMEVCANQSVVGIVDPQKRHSEYLYYTFKEIIREVIQHASGGAQQHINKDIVNDVKIVLPSADRLQQFNGFVVPACDQIANLLRKNINLRRTRDLLLPKLISGEVDVSELEIEMGATGS